MTGERTCQTVEPRTSLKEPRLLAMRTDRGKKRLRFLNLFPAFGFGGARAAVASTLFG